jgi:hypothetical protein
MFEGASRREFVQRAGLVAGAASLSPFVGFASEDEPAQSRKPDDILARLMEGNKRFSSGKTKLVPRGPRGLCPGCQRPGPPCDHSRMF